MSISIERYVAVYDPLYKGVLLAKDVQEMEPEVQAELAECPIEIRNTQR